MIADEHRKSHAEEEHDVLDYWDDQKIFERSVQDRPEGNPYVFYDGPPFATGLPHYGHIVASVMKDVVPRFWTMKGYRVERKWGWDCHGLPIENIVEKKLDLGSRDDIVELGVSTFNNKCHEEVMKYAEEWKSVIRRLGRWVDMENDYKTMDLDFMESVWWVFKAMWEKDLIYEDRKPMHVCPRCETVLSKFEVAQGYEDVTDLSVFVTFPILDGAYQGANLLAWTTTPWTLPGNLLAAIHPSLSYVQVTCEEVRYILAKDRVAEVFFGKDFTIGEEVSTKELIGSHYEPLFPYFHDWSNAFRIVKGDFVTLEEGTGVVHIAAGFGEDDQIIAKQENVEPIMHVKMNGHFIDAVADSMSEEGYEVKDRPVRSKKDPLGVDIEIVKWLAHHGRLFRKEKVTHSYPHCWRCDTPLLNYGTTSWFVAVGKILDQLVKCAEGIHWVPEHIKDGRFGKGLAESPEWSISRSRFWGTPLPIWRAQDGEVIVVGSVAELEELAGSKVKDLHKQFVDELVIKKNGKTYTRIPEVLDCWFESGSMPYAQLHYPFENEEKFDRGFPAEFIAEGVDQTRLWFHKLHVVANILFDMPAFKNVIVNGIVLAEDGKKMSKKLQNYPDPMEVMEKYGADAVRYYLMSSPVVRAENLRFSESEVADVSKRFISILRNVLAFYELYREQDDGREAKREHVLDRWILARLDQTLKEETTAMEAYDLQGAARPLQQFVTDLSTWYVRRSRDRLKALLQENGDREDALEALATLRMVLDTFSKMLAPFMPMLAELVYQSVDGGFLGSKNRLSVHLESWPEAGKVDQDILDRMGEVRATVSRALEIREEAGRAVKQPLASMTITLPTGKLAKAYVDVVLDEVNIKQAEIKKGEMHVEVDLNLTPELVREGMARDVMRRVNQLRKDAGLTIEDRIDLKVWSPSDDVRQMFAGHEDAIREGTLATSITFEKDEGVKHQNDVRVQEQDVWIGF